ncbi:conserved hypothetical protein [Tenacibaculum sp. 190524A02b]|uniref:Integrase catalytic domain-containing protein n=1 Tax=Tenacibaculum vairaonense TaxID=3137860 RepID=A0ABM9PQZ9_9FLAO
MPKFWNNIYVVTKDELIPKFWKSYNNLNNEIWRYRNNENYGVKRAQYGGNSRELLIIFDTLPKHVQDAIGDERKTQHPLERFYKIKLNTVSFYNDFTYPDGNYLPPQTIEQYIINATVLQAVLELKKAREFERSSKGGSLRGINKTLINDLKSFNEILSDRFKVTHNIPTSTRFAQKLDDFNTKGLISVIKDPEQKRKSNALKNDEPTQRLLNAMFASQKKKPTPTEVSDQYKAFLAGYVQIVNKETDEIYDPKAYKTLSDSTIKNFLTNWDSTIATHAIRNGDRQKLIQKFIPYISFSQAKHSGSLLSIDDRQPPFNYEGSKRMWFYNAIDTGSEAFTCWVYGKTKEGIILDFYRQLVRNYHNWGLNLPDGLECESSLNSSFKDTFLQEGTMFQDVRIEANKARGKRIERYYRDLRYTLEKEREGWLARPSALSESNQAGNEKRIIIPYQKLVKQCLTDIMTWNNMEHSKIKGKTRWEVFLETQNPNLKPTNYKAFLQYLGYHTQTSCNAGIVNLQNGKFVLGDKGEIYTGALLINLMKKIEGKNIDVYWLDDNQGEVFKALAYINGRYVCELQSKPIPPRAKIERTPADEVKLAIMASYANTVSSYMKTKKNDLEKVSIIDLRSKTLNNKFQIDELIKTETPPPKTEDLPNYDKEQQHEWSSQESDTGQSWDKAFDI